MRTDLIAYLDNRRNYLKNRATFPIDKLAKYAGEWVAWSPDGTCILAHTADPRLLDDLVRTLGEDPQECIVEGIPAEGSVIGHIEPDIEGRHET